MRFADAPQSWLSTRIRLLCIAAFVISLFLPPYIPESVTASPPDMDTDPREFLLAEEGFLTKTSSLTEQGTRSAYTQGIIHVVEKGETVAGIARQSFLAENTVRWANGLSPSATIKPGQKLLILPVDGILHSVKRGQNLQMIADLYDVPADAIRQQNQLKGGYLQASQELIIPGGKPIVEAPPKPPKVATPSKPGTAPGKVPPSTQPVRPTYGILQMPCDCFVTQYFSAVHFGADLQHRGGSTIFAGEAGTVIRAERGWNGGYGNVIEIDHGNGLLTLYAHNKELYVSAGDKVARGQPIAFMGNSGRVHGPTGIHLHFEVHQNGMKKNPFMYLQQ